MQFELFVATRYLRAKRRQAVIGIITIISIVGVAAGVASLIIALAINNGFRQDLQDRLLGSSSHINLLRVEARIPDHEITRNNFGLWTWSIDYAPVAIGGKTFWMPKTIESEAIPNDHLVAWSFVARYSNYHKLEVNSRIITDLSGNPPPPPQ